MLAPVQLYVARQVVAEDGGLGRAAGRGGEQRGEHAGDHLLPPEGEHGGHLLAAPLQGEPQRGLQVLHVPPCMCGTRAQPCSACRNSRPAASVTIIVHRP